jgi:hypothetical protein
MEKQDLRQYSENELSLIVFNDETLYRMRKRILYSPDILTEYFIFDPDQLSVLLNNIEQDLNEG